MRSIRFLFGVLLLAFLATTVNAYTIVMRDGRKVVIPDQFTVTNSTLTYEVGPGIQITIQLNSVDLPATERVNGHPLRAAPQKAASPSAADETQRPVAQRSITNAHLEVLRQVRVNNELAYEERRKELGLPSKAELRRELTEIEERTQEQVRSIRAAEQNSEEYWRARAGALRAEIASTQAQIGYARRRLDEIPLSYSFGAFSTVIPFGAVAGPAVGFPVQNLLTPNVFAPSAVTRSGFRVRGGVQATFQSGRRRVTTPARSGRVFSRGSGRFNSFPGSVLALPFQSLDYNLERTELVGQLNALEMHLAGLNARWRELEDEARRAGAYPGWLR